MVFYSGGGSIVQEPHYLFIDGASLDKALELFATDFCGGETPKINWSAVLNSRRKAFYYDAIPVRQNGEDATFYEDRVADRRNRLKLIERERGFHVRTGVVKHRGPRRGNEQKMVDVQLAVDGLLMASRGLFGTVTLITGDLDFLPLIEAWVEMGVQVHLNYPHGATSEELMAAADHADALLPAAMWGWLDPAQQKALPLPYGHMIPMGPFDPPFDHPSDVVQTEEWGECRLSWNGSESQIMTERSASENIRLHVVGPDRNIRAFARAHFGITFVD